jgi:hypothetical protein
MPSLTRPSLSFANWQRSQPRAQLPGDQLDAQIQNLVDAITSTQKALAPGKHTLVFDFKYDGLGAETLAYNNLSGVGRGGTGTLSVDGKVVATTKMGTPPR